MHNVDSRAVAVQPVQLHQNTSEVLRFSLDEFRGKRCASVRVCLLEREP